MSDSEEGSIAENWEDESVPENWEQESVEEGDAEADPSAPATAEKAAAPGKPRRKPRKAGQEDTYEEDPWAAKQFERLDAEYERENNVHKEYNSEDLTPPLMLKKISKGEADDYLKEVAKAFRSACNTGLGHGPTVDALKYIACTAASSLGVADLEQLVGTLERSKLDAESRETVAREAKAAEKKAKAAAKKAAEDKAAEDAAAAAAAETAAAEAAKAAEEAAKLAQVNALDDEDFM